MHEITQEIKDDLIFARAQRGRRQMPVKHQLMIWLLFIGHEGNACPNQYEVFKISKGMRKKARDCVVALNNARKEYIFRPDAEERREITQRIECNYHLPNCPMMMDGTLLCL